MSTKESGGDLRALAQAATPGPWEVYSTIDAEDFVVEAGRGLFRTIATPARRVDYARTNAAFIAAADPAAVMALLDELEALRAKMERVEALVDNALRYGPGVLNVRPDHLRVALGDPQ